MLGRYFTEAEDQPPDGAPVAVMSYAAWETQFAGRRDVIGSKVQIGSIVFTIIGVAPKGFVGLWPSQPPAYFVPVTTIGGVNATRITLRNVWWKSYQWGWLTHDRAPEAGRQHRAGERRSDAGVTGRATSRISSRVREFLP